LVSVRGTPGNRVKRLYRLGLILVGSIMLNLSSITTNNYFMIIVHDIFICKPGNASKVAKLFKEWADVAPQKNVSVMTDMTGQFHRVVIASSFESLGAYEEGMKTMGQSEEEKKVMEKFKDMNEMYVSGSREIFKVW
jgi:hypothetical protein